jgi:hypothetical protein
VYVLREADYVRYIKAQNADKRAKYSAFLSSVPLLSELLVRMPFLFMFIFLSICFSVAFVR